MRLCSSETETRRNFGVPRPRRGARLYVSCFSLSQGCRVKVGSRSDMFLVGVGTEVVFLKDAQTGVAYLDVLELMRDSYLSLATPTPIFDELLNTIVIFIM